MTWTHFCRHNCFNSLWHRFNKELEPFLRDCSPYWKDIITELLQICGLHVYVWFILFYHSKDACWILIWSLSWVWDNLSFVTCCIMLLEAAIRWEWTWLATFVPRKYPPHHYKSTATSWTVDARRGGAVLSCCLHQILIWMLQQTSRLIRAGIIFQISYCSIMVNLWKL